MKSTLYISDLDGTLLNEKAELSPYTLEIINKFIDQGGLFSFATGRTLESSRKIMAPLHLNLPVVFSNGVSTYDPVEKRFISTAHFSNNALAALDSILDSNQMRGFYYMMQEEETHVFHKSLLNELEQQYLEFRMNMYAQGIKEVENILTTASAFLPYFCVVYGKQEDMVSISNQINHTPGLQTSLYSDVYNSNYFMDIYPSEASKLAGMQVVQRISRANRTTSFGDNYNDLSMLEGANESYAVAGAVAEAKALATGIIGKSSEDAVAKFLAEKYNL